MTEPVFLEPDVVMFLHDQSIREYGGYHGVRDEALLASALDRPQNKFAYETEADLAALAASYAFGIAKNHAFLDGNKRTAWSCCVLFLKINSVEILAPAVEAVENTVALATSQMSEDAFAAWLRGCIRPPRK
jgi:death-on-curing protein